MKKKLTERDIFNHVFNKSRLDNNSLKLLEEDPNYKELKEYYEYLINEISSGNKKDILEISEKIRKKLDNKD